MDGPTLALAACIGCGCGCGGLAVAPQEALPGPLADIQTALFEVVGGFGSGGYSYGGGQWDQGSGTWR